MLRMLALIAGLLLLPDAAGAAEWPANLHAAHLAPVTTNADLAARPHEKPLVLLRCLPRVP